MMEVGSQGITAVAGTVKTALLGNASTTFGRWSIFEHSPEPTQQQRPQTETRSLPLALVPAYNPDSRGPIPTGYIVK